MSNTNIEPKTSKRKAKENEPLAKSKRPRSAYNFFVQAERAKIVAEESSNKQSGDSDGGKKTSFEEIGRIIGQRWRNIAEDELARYKELAKVDSERYQEEMKAFYNAEVALMSQGNIANNDMEFDASIVDRQPLRPEAGYGSLFASQSVAATSGSSTQNQAAAAAQLSVASAQMMGLPHSAAAGQGQPQTERASTAVFASNPIMSLSLQNSTGSKLSDSLTLMDDQIIQLLIQHQQSSSSPYTNDAIKNLIQSLKASFQHRAQELTLELNKLQLKNAVLDTIIANERLKTPQVQPEPGHRNRPSVAAASSLGGVGSMGSMATDQLLSLLQQQQNIDLNGLLTALGSDTSLTEPQGQQHFGATLHGPPAPTFSTQNPLFQSYESSSTSSSSRNIPTNNSAMPTQQGSQLADQVSLLRRFLDENK